MAVKRLNESNRIFAVEVDMEGRSPEEIARDAAQQINILFEILMKEQQENVLHFYLQHSPLLLCNKQLCCKRSC